MEGIMGDEYCTKCVMKRGQPGIVFDGDGVCNVCNMEIDIDLGANYAFAMQRFTEFKDHAGKADSDYDCIFMLSGGKDSTYLLHKLAAEMGKRVLAFTYNMPYESNFALKNIERIQQRLPVDHILFTSTVNHHKLMKKAFLPPSGTSDQLFSEKAPCRLCRTYYILSGFWTAYRMQVPYVVFAYDPMQSISNHQTIKSFLGEWVETIGQQFLAEVYGHRIDTLLTAPESRLPKIVYPYVGSIKEYDEKAMIAEIKRLGLYESNPMLTYCDLWALQNYYSYTYHDCFYLTHTFAAKVRRGQFPREKFIRADRVFREVIPSVMKMERLSETDRQALRKRIDEVLGDDPETAQWVFERISGMRQLIEEMGFELEI